jgi:ABC-2 type transport system permease protein
MNTLHIYKKEMRNYFNSSIAYVLFAIFLFIVGFIFAISLIRYSEFSMMAVQNPQMMGRLNAREMIVSPLFGLMAFLMVFLIPVLTMRIFSEERKQGTVELLFTYPITEFQLVFGKFLASVTVLLVMFLFTFAYTLILAKYITPMPWPVIGAGYLGLLLVSVAFLALGTWISSITSDQVTAALATVGGLLMFWIIGNAGMLGDVPPTVRTVFEQLAISEHFQGFAMGTIDTHNIVFMLSFTFLFIFMTIQALETRKWKG